MRIQLLKVNDKVISLTDAPANRWTNWGRDSAEDSNLVICLRILALNHLNYLAGTLHVGFPQRPRRSLQARYVVRGTIQGNKSQLFQATKSASKTTTDRPLNNQADWKEVQQPNR